MKRLILAGSGSAVGGTPPDPFLVDSFTGADGTLLTAHTGETGATWVLVTGNTLDGAIATNRWRCATNSSTSAVRASGTPSTNNYRVTANVRVVTVITANSNSVGVIGRCSESANTFYHARLVPSSGVWQLYRFVAGAATQLGANVAVTLTAGQDYQLDLIMVDDQISLAVNDVTVIGPVTDTSITAAGRAGVRGAGSGVTASTGAHLSDIEAVPV